jgi:glycosyltransferase involved in cell wall biosynthesis
MSLVEQLAQLPNVSVHGYADWEQLRGHYEWANLLVLPSHTEGMPRVVHEAVAFDNALVLTPVGGVPMRFRDERDALLVPVGDADALEAALRKLVEDPWRIPVLATSARPIVSAFFTAESPAHQFDCVLRKAAASATGTR